MPLIKPGDADYFGHSLSGINLFPSSSMHVQARAGRIYVDDAGAGECPSVFIHSLAGNSRHWLWQLQHVRSEGCAIAFDLRGHGRSDPPDNGDYSLEACSEDLQAVVDALGVDQFILIGHSMGAAVATVYAASHPEQVRGLVLVDPVGDQRLAPEQMQEFLIALDTRRYDELIRDYWSTLAGPDRNVRDQVLRDLDRTPRAAVLGMLRALQRTDLTHAVQSCDAPKLAVITPHNNFPFSLHNVDATIETVIVPGTGHWLQMEKPEEFNALLDGFAAKVSARPRP